MLTPDKIRELREQLDRGVRAVSAPQLFQTPKDIAGRMARLACITPGMTVLEPSAGTGRLLDEILEYTEPENVGAVEMNVELFQHLSDKYAECRVWCANFLETEGIEIPMMYRLGSERYDRVVMNPPFEKGSDIKHIYHALKMVKPGGRLVALCAAGPRQRAAFKDTFWEELPQGSFKEAGTSVNVALVVIDKP